MVGASEKTRFRFFNSYLSEKMALDIWGERMRLGLGMSYMQPWTASALKTKPKIKPNPTKHLGQLAQ